jgi:2-hydroxychromene-2-carboxylate isomerase
MHELGMDRDDLMRVQQFWFEFASTYSYPSYPAAMHIEHEATRCDVAIEWKPFQLRGVALDPAV